MRLKFQYDGAKKTVCLLVLDDADDGECPSLEYLQNLEAQNKVSHRAMIRRITNHGDIGATTIWKHGHAITDRQNLFVWKTHQGARLLYFNLTGASVIVTHGYGKGAPERQQYDRAERLRDAWLNQGVRHGTGT